MDYEKYFKLLEKKEKIEKIDKIKDFVICNNCNEKNVKIIEYHNSLEICTNCGSCDNFLEIIEPINYLNKNFHLTTIIVGGKCSTTNYKIKRLQKWKNYNYKEYTMTKSFEDIKNICNHLNLNNLNNKVYEISISKYKNIFLDKKISSRDNIKKAIYIYCIVFSCNYLNIKINVDDIINFVNIQKKHYLKGLKKVDKNNIYFIKKNVESKIKLCNDNNIYINKNIIYDEYYLYTKKNLKINKNSLILYLFFKNLNIPDKDFINIFNTTKVTIKKFNDLLNNI